MKTSLSLLLATAGAAVARNVVMENLGEIAANEELTTEFKQWMAANDKEYSGKTAIERQAIYYKNKFIVERMAAENDNDQAQYKLNKFADRNAGEMLMEINSPMDADVQAKHMLPDLPVDDLPESWDWRDKGAVTDVANQGSAGSCWSFSAVGAMEGGYFIKHNKLQQLSPEFLVECDPRDCGVFGGWPYKAYEFTMAEGGIPADKDIPYCVGGFGCLPCMAKHYDKTMCGKHKDLICNKDRHVCDILEDKKKIAATVTDWFNVGKDEDQMRAALVKYGPLSVALNANWLQFYFGGVSNPWFCDPLGLNHAVLIVGYGSETSAVGTEKPYWIVKNSWGESWGEQGYFRMIRNVGKCGINTAVTFPVMG
ncbi:hypothetical protein SARC_09047 [Sphaeroforma arctica JP610]|uniref:Peptidase C1A papain C-terminal domain-containing protein n=1 Tax=Sphaeroforma arctica JP610 TaxID=667725 RepID=A0A0L0FNZ7_9EUKA|nr:hypothetical protein SARC_09047 [Sphaeroforma arctica JP610]KNC78522.1 hypothetical protein SARC_09047 [Sphaeroforma arctica JP610]|eukprot:XP_014152424.1 hypothetical protein SARC_09047 [Sphaeroforma arctica JP610]